jgi:hypothetical protein
MLANKGAIIASAIGAVIVICAAVYFLAPGIFGSPSPPPAGGDGNGNPTTTASEAPRMLLMLLESAEDASPAVAQYEANNTEPIQLASNAHIRFDSPDYRTAESMRVIARDVNTGEIELLRKSYDVNNQFFVNVGPGNYEFQVQASWFERGSFVYDFNIMVT